MGRDMVSIIFKVREDLKGLKYLNKLKRVSGRMRFNGPSLWVSVNKKTPTSIESSSLVPKLRVQTPICNSKDSQLYLYINSSFSVCSPETL
jgi:hypothetical protein